MREFLLLNASMMVVHSFDAASNEEARATLDAHCRANRGRLFLARVVAARKAEATETVSVGDANGG